MKERELERDEASKFETSFEAIVQISKEFVPMLSHTYLFEDPVRPGTGVVVGHMISERGEKMFIPLGIIAPDGRALTLFTEISRQTTSQ